ncbi:MAG: hypothetical protein NZM35_08695, partial [Chitinophagales bacterium]|nr:hypothetical protein [Chitinophagales bacterium]
PARLRRRRAENSCDQKEYWSDDFCVITPLQSGEGCGGRECSEAAAPVPLKINKSRARRERQRTP